MAGSIGIQKQRYVCCNESIELLLKFFDFVDDFDAVDLSAVGARIQKHAFLPESANIGLAEIIDDTHIKFQVYERPGVLTQACGSGASHS